QLPATLETIDVRKHQIDEYDIRPLSAEQREAALTTIGLRDFVAFVLQRQPHRGPDPIVVLNHQDTRHMPPSSSAETPAMHAAYDGTCSSGARRHALNLHVGRPHSWPQNSRGATARRGMS